MIRYTGSALLALLLLLGIYPTDSEAQETQVAVRDATKATAVLINAQGKQIGSATLTETPKGVRVEAEVSGLKPGEHAFHVHEKGECEAPTFKSAGGHFNPTGRKHGIEVPGGPHVGDLPNIIVGRDGSGRLSTINPYATLETGKKNSLLKQAGTALIIHAGSDDYNSQPSGDAGERVACGQITRD